MPFKNFMPFKSFQIRQKTKKFLAKLTFLVISDFTKPGWTAICPKLLPRFSHDPTNSFSVAGKKGSQWRAGIGYHICKFTKQHNN